MTNNEKFNRFINSCENPRQVMAALRVLAAKPCVHQTADVLKESQIGQGELLPFADVSHINEQRVGLV